MSDCVCIDGQQSNPSKLSPYVAFLLSNYFAVEALVLVHLQFEFIWMWIKADFCFTFPYDLAKSKNGFLLKNCFCRLQGKNDW